MKLYHGSNKLIFGNLRPAVSFHYVPYVYATSDIYYALIRCGRFDVNKLLLKEDYDGRKITLVELTEGAFERVFDCEGYIYVVDAATFWCSPEMIPNEYVSDRACGFLERVRIPNVKDEILSRPERYSIIRYGEDADYWKGVRGGKEGYLRRRLQRAAKIRSKYEEMS